MAVIPLTDTRHLNQKHGAHSDRLIQAADLNRLPLWERSHRADVARGRKGCVIRR